jgi:5-methylcytosine-specific restriction enzyme A
MNIEKITDSLIFDTGLRFDGKTVARKGKTILQFVSADLPQNSGFEILVELGYRHIEATFKLQIFSGHLINLMQSTSVETKKLVQNLLEANSDQAEIILTLNDRKLDYQDIVDFSENWKDIEIQLISKPIESEIDLELRQNINELILFWVEKTISILYPLLPLEEDIEDSIDAILEKSAEEGRQYQVTSTRYERKRQNRVACLAYFGFDCIICGFDFFESFGDIGAGYIHVHHLTPVSLIGEDYKINPVQDLIPVCPNCHAMLHSQTPPLTPEELKTILGNNN